MKELKNDLKETFAYMLNCFMIMLWVCYSLVIGIPYLIAYGVSNALEGMTGYPNKRIREYIEKIS